jgi:hypothetical protein
MERKISYSLYGLAFLLSVIVFSIGIYVGYLIDQYNQQSISQQVDEISQKVSSTQLLFLLEGNGTAFCPVYDSQLDSINADIEKIGYKLSYMEEEKHLYDVSLKKNYFVLEAQSLLLSERMKERCGDNSTLLVYFYSNSNCSSCKQQGNDILRARDETQGKAPLVRIYSFDGDLGSPVANGLKTQFNVTQYPSIVVNGRLYNGAMPEDALARLLAGG